MPEYEKGLFYFYLGNQAYIDGDFACAKSWYECLSRCNSFKETLPKEVNAVIDGHLGDMHYDSGNMDEVSTIDPKSIALPISQRTIGEVGKYYVEEYPDEIDQLPEYEKGLLYFYLGNKDYAKKSFVEAKNWYEWCLDCNSFTKTLPKGVEAVIDCRLGDIHYDSGNYAEAKRYYEPCLNSSWFESRRPLHNLLNVILKDV